MEKIEHVVFEKISKTKSHRKQDPILDSRSGRRILKNKILLKIRRVYFEIFADLNRRARCTAPGA